jgi:hypothetical protein
MCGLNCEPPDRQQHEPRTSEIGHCSVHDNCTEDERKRYFYEKSAATWKRRSFISTKVCWLWSHERPTLRQTVELLVLSLYVFDSFVSIKGHTRTRLWISRVWVLAAVPRKTISWQRRQLISNGGQVSLNTNSFDQVRTTLCELEVLYFGV